MIIKLYQVNKEKDVHKVMFESLEDTFTKLKSSVVDSSIYDLVYSGEVEAGTLDDVYAIFNVYRPEDYMGRSMSVSDVVEVIKGNDNVEPGYYFCDFYRFTKIDFIYEASKSEIISIVYVAPYEKAVIRKIDASLKTMQFLVGGYLEPVAFWEDDVVLVCNEEGKINGLSPNRIIMHNGKPVDVICGNFFITAFNEDGEFVSLTEEQQKEYVELFNNEKTYADTVQSK